MSENIYDELKNNLYQYLVHLMEVSNPYVTKQALSWKVLQQCADILKIKLNRNLNKKLIYIHPENISRIDSKWQSMIDSDVKLTQDEVIMYERIKSSEYVDIYDLSKFISILINKDCEKGEKILKDTFLYKLLAIDGFLGYSSGDVKSYLENVKTSKECNHIRTLREIYETMDVSVQLVHFALLCVYEQYAKDDEVKQVVENVKKDLENQIDTEKLQEIVSFYESNVDNPEVYALTKLSQLVNKTKKTKSVQQKQIRKKLINEKSAKKRKLTEDEEE